MVVVWQPSEPGAEGMIRAAVVGPGREVKIDTLFVRTPGALLSTLAPVAAGGRFAFVGWEWLDSTGSHLGVAEWNGLRWAVDSLREGPRRTTGHSSVAIDGRGNAVAIWWQDPDPVGSVATPVRAAYRPAGASWPAPRTIARLHRDDVDVLAPPTAAFRRPGRPVVSWASPWRGVPVKVSARARFAGRWRAAAPPATPRSVVRLDREGLRSTLLVVAGGGADQYLSDAPGYADLVADGRRVVLVWTPPSRDRLPSSPQPVYYSELEFDGFSGPFGVSDINNTSEASALLRPDGTLLVAYVGASGVFTVALDPRLGWRRSVSVAP